MRTSRLVLPLLGLISLSLLGCSREAGNAVLSGACSAWETHCVDSETIQYCEGEAWGEPEACPLDIAGEGPFEVEIITYCGDGACRPAG